MRMGGMVSLPPLPCQWPDDPLGWPRSAPERKETCMSETRGWTVPSGIGGWLYLVAVGLCLTPVRLVLEIGRGLRLLDPATWHAVTTPGRPAYHPLFGPLIVGELAANGILLFWTFGLLYLFFTRRRIFPPMMVTFLIVRVLIQTADLLVARLIPAAATAIGPSVYSALGGSLVLVLVWVPYLCRSQRVANTFMR